MFQEGNSWGLLMMLLVPFIITSILIYFGLYFLVFCRRIKKLRVFHISGMYMYYQIIIIILFRLYEIFDIIHSTIIARILGNTFIASIVLTAPIFFAALTANRIFKNRFDIQYGLAIVLSIFFQIVIFVLYGYVNIVLQNTPD